MPERLAEGMAPVFADQVGSKERWCVEVVGDEVLNLGEMEGMTVSH